MAKRLPLTDKDGEVRELTKDDLKRFKSATDILPRELAEILPKRGRPAGTATKTSTTVRFDNDVLEAFKAMGKGWQSRMNAALRDWLKEHRP
jgi:uncharacterized protein (DUF4415 family)